MCKTSWAASSGGVASMLVETMLRRYRRCANQDTSEAVPPYEPGSKWGGAAIGKFKGITEAGPPWTYR